MVRVAVSAEPVVGLFVGWLEGLPVGLSEVVVGLSEVAARLGSSTGSCSRV